MAYLFKSTLDQFFDSNALPLANGTLTFYEAGTNVLLNTYSDSGLSVLNPSPVPLNGSGRPQYNCYTDAVSFDVELRNSSASLIANANGCIGQLPDASIADNGKALGVVSGSYALIPVADGSASFVTVVEEANLTNSKILASSDFTVGVSGSNVNVNYPEAVDGGNLVTGAEIINSREGKQTISAGTGAMTFDYSLGSVINMNQTGNISSIAITNVPAFGACVVTLVRRQTVVTAFTITWGAAFDFPAGTPPSLTASTTAADIISMLTVDGGVTWLCTSVVNV